MDLAVAPVALDALVITRDSDGEHPIRISDFFRQPGNTPSQEHNMPEGALITAVEVPVRPDARRSGYLKVRDRASYEFALASAAEAAARAADGARPLSGDGFKVELVKRTVERQLAIVGGIA